MPSRYSSVHSCRRRVVPRPTFPARSRRACAGTLGAWWWVYVGMLGLLVGTSRPGYAQGSGEDFATTVRADRAAAARDGASSVSVVELGLPGQPGAPSAAKPSVAEALVGLPGTQIRSAGGLGQWSGAQLRGAAATQVAVMLDGVPLARGAQAAVDLSQLSVDGLERIEVHRGIPPLESGIDAIGGAINLVTRRGPHARTVWGSAGSGSFGLRRLSVGYSSGQRHHSEPHITASLGYQGATGDFPFFFNSGVLYGRGQLDELLRRNDGFDQGGIDVRVSIPGQAHRGYVQASGMLRRQGIPGIGQDGVQTGSPTLQTGRALLQAGSMHLLAAAHLQLHTDAHALLERTALQDLEGQPARRSEQLSEQAGAHVLLKLHRLAVLPSTAAPPSSGPEQQTLILMLEGRHESLQQSDLCPAPRLDCANLSPFRFQRLRALFALGAELQTLGGTLQLQPGLHFLWTRSEQLQPVSDTLPDAAAPAPKLLSFPAPRLTARLRLSSVLLLRAGVGQFIRLPTFLELFGDRAFYRPSPTLRPESAWSGELGGQLHTTVRSKLALSLELHGFFRQVSDLIDIIRDGPTLRARNVGSARTLGLEAEASAQLGQLLALRLAYTFLDARDLTDESSRHGKLLPGRAPHTLFARFSTGYRALQLFYELDFAALLYLDPANLQPRPERTLHALGLQLGPVWPTRISLGVEVRNLLDTRIVQVPLPLSRTGETAPVPLSDYFDFPLPGRALYATLSARL